MTTELNLIIRAGADYRHDFYIYVSEDDSEPRDLTGDQFDAEFRESDAKGRVLFTLSMGNGLDIVDALNGHVRMTIARSVTEGLRFRDTEIEGTFDIEITDSTGFPRSRAVEGSHVITLDNTRNNNNGGSR